MRGAASAVGLGDDVPGLPQIGVGRADREPAPGPERPGALHRDPRHPCEPARLHAVLQRAEQQAADVLLYQVTIDDPSTFTRPWTIELPAVPSDGEIYEYACHEGNYGLEDILRGHRAEEQKATEGSVKKQ